MEREGKGGEGKEERGEREGEGISRKRLKIAKMGKENDKERRDMKGRRENGRGR